MIIKLNQILFSLLPLFLVFSNFLSDFTISIDSNSAHASYLNTGVFVYPNPYAPDVLLKENKQWLESVFIIREGEDLKIKFLQSDEIYSKVSVFKKSS